jgi:hypothetical protein
VTPPLLILGVRRSGTTLLRVMLDRNSQLAVPDESYFVPQLAHRHGRRPDIDAFVEDIRRLETLREWGISPEDVRSKLRRGMTTGEAISAIYEAYAHHRGKPRWGDKTPMYMQHLPLLERLFPEARYVHLIRDGRDTAVSFLAMPQGIVTRSWAHPRSIGDFACEWRVEVEAARRLGDRVGPGRYVELRYEAFVAEPERELQAICAFGDLPWEPGMLDYVGNVDVSRKPHQQRLAQPPTRGVRDWRRDLPPGDVEAFESVAGGLLHELGYETRLGVAATARGRLRLARYRGLITAWNGTAYVLQRSPLWRRRHPPLV